MSGRGGRTDAPPRRPRTWPGGWRRTSSGRWARTRPRAWSASGASGQARGSALPSGPRQDRTLRAKNWRHSGGECARTAGAGALTLPGGSGAEVRLGKGATVYLPLLMSSLARRRCSQTVVEFPWQVRWHRLEPGSLHRFVLALTQKSRALRLLGRVEFGTLREVTLH